MMNDLIRAIWIAIIISIPLIALGRIVEGTPKYAVERMLAIRDARDAKLWAEGYRE